MTPIHLRYLLFVERRAGLLFQFRIDAKAGLKGGRRRDSAGLRPCLSGGPEQHNLNFIVKKDE